MRVSQTSCPPSSFVAQSEPPKPSAQMHTPRLWGTTEGGSEGTLSTTPVPPGLTCPTCTWLQVPAPLWALQFSGHRAMRQCGPAQPWGQRQSPAPASPPWGTHSWGTGQLPGPPDPQRAEPTEALKPQDEEPFASQCSTSSPVGERPETLARSQSRHYSTPGFEKPPCNWVGKQGTSVIHDHCHDLLSCTPHTLSFISPSSSIGFKTSISHTHPSGLASSTSSPTPPPPLVFLGPLHSAFYSSP